MKIQRKKTLKKESLGKRTLNQRGNPTKRTPSDDANIGGDPEDPEYDGVSYDVDLSKYGKKDSTLLRIKMNKPVTEKEFIDQSAYHILAECHDIINDSIFAVGHSFYVIENALYDRTGHLWDYGEPAMFVPNEENGSISLCLVEYGSWSGNVYPLTFNNSSEMDLILDDIYTFFPFLEKYPLENDLTITFNVGNRFIDRCHDADSRNQFAWMWDDDVQYAKQVEKDQIDSMWNKRKKHEINKDAEEEEMWKKHDDEERAKKDALDAELSELDDDNEYMESNMKKLNITKKQYNESKYFQTKYGKLEYVSESGKLYKTTKGKVLKFNESLGVPNYEEEYQKSLEEAQGMSKEEIKAVIDDILDEDWWEYKSEYTCDEEPQYRDMCERGDFYDAQYDALYGNDPEFTAFMDTLDKLNGKSDVEQPVAESHDDIENDPAYTCPICGGHNCEFEDCEDPGTQEGYFDGSKFTATWWCADCGEAYAVTFKMNVVDVGEIG